MRIWEKLSHFFLKEHGWGMLLQLGDNHTARRSWEERCS